MKKISALLCILLISSFIITACSGNTTTPATTVPAVTTTAATTAPVTSNPATTTKPPVATSSVPLSVTASATTTTPAGPTPKRGGILKLITSGPTNLGVPWAPNAPTDLFFACPAVETLLRTDDKGTPVPWLATGWTVAPDYKSITFTLRKGVKFHDGTDFDASALKYDMETNAKSPMPEFKAITSVDVIDQYTAKVNLSTWVPQIFSFLAVGRPGWIVSPKAAQSMTTEQMLLNPVGTGPFKFQSFTRDVSVKFTRFDQYWQTGKPYLDGIEYDIITDPVTSTIFFKSGGADVIYNDTPKNANDMKNQGYNVTAAPASIYQFVPDSANAKLADGSPNPWANVDVRRAAQYAIDTVSMAKAQGFGWADPYWNQVFPKGNPAYDPTIVGYPYDVAKAKAALAKGGFPNGFKTSLYVTVPPVGDLEPAVQNYLQQVGINAQMVPLAGASNSLANTTGWQNGLFRTQSPSSLGADPGYTMTQNLSTPPTAWFSVSRPQDLQDLLKTANSQEVAIDPVKRQAAFQAVAKNVIDTNALVISTWGGYLLASKQNYVMGDMIRTRWTMTWTPEDAWLNK
jgi:peptide/nickel transport system substrate-binding protein